MSAPSLRIDRTDVGRLAVGAAVLGAAVALVAVTVATARDLPVVTGLPEAGAGTALAASGARLASRVAAVVVVGGLLVPAWLVGAGAVPARVLRAVRVAAWVWVGATLLAMVAAGAEALAVPLGSALTSGRVWAFVPSLGGGRALMSTAVLAALVASGTRVARGPGEHLLLLGTALVATLPTSLTGHVATAELHVAVSVGTTVHVLGAVLWVGGLVGLGMLGRSPALPGAVARFSSLALAAVVVVTVTGLLAAWWRLGADAPAWRSAYGALVVAKVALLVVLVGLGGIHRRWSIPALQRGSAGTWWRLAVVETTVMGATLGVATALGRTATPTRPGVVALPHGGVTTVDRYLPAPTPTSLVLEPRGSATGAVAVTLVLLLLVLAVSRAGTAPRAALRGLGFGLAGTAVLGWLLLGGPGSYGSAILGVHGTQVVGAALLAAPLLVASARALAPGRLPLPRRGLVDAVLPFIVLALVVYGTPLLTASLGSEVVHTLVVLVAVGAGIPVALRVGTDRRVGVALLAVLGAVLLVVLMSRPDAFAPDWFANLPLDWADPVRGTDVGTRAA
ncbi:CopD family protein [Phycicoccus avicenniae]|uniref:CopD family protein n=1 Tax=Phycicoccus avicenniae TaxID=2828860 RepID=UPI003D2ABF40